MKKTMRRMTALMMVLSLCAGILALPAAKEFLIHALGSSKFDMGIPPELTDRILTLSTCSGTGGSTRWVVHGRLKMVQVP